MGGVASPYAAPGKENARERRRRMRAQAAVYREGEALRLFVEGLTYDEIAVELRVASSTAWDLVKRGLERRAAEEGPIVEQARALYVERLERLYQAWAPRAFGKGLDAELRPREPNEGAAKIVLGCLDRFADVMRVIPKSVEVNLTGDRPQTPDDLIAGVLGALARTAEKDRTIEGHLADAGTNLDQATGGNNRKAPPPTVPRERNPKS